MGTLRHDFRQVASAFCNGSSRPEYNKKHNYFLISKLNDWLPSIQAARIVSGFFASYHRKFIIPMYPACQSVCWSVGRLVARPVIIQARVVTLPCSYRSTFYVCTGCPEKCCFTGSFQYYDPPTRSELLMVKLLVKKLILFQNCFILFHYLCIDIYE